MRVPGKARHRATIRKHNGNTDEHRIPTKDIDSDWIIVSEAWPCQLETVGGGERIRGRQVTSETSHIMLGEYYGAKDARPDMRVHLEKDGTTKIYSITAAYDPDEMNREYVIEAKIET